MQLTLIQGRIERATEKSAGYDLFSAEKDRVLLRPGERVRVDVGVRTQFDQGHVALVCDKSGIAFKAGVTTLAGVIDGDFPDNWGVILLNTGREAYIINPGDKVAQVLFLKLAELSVEVQGDATFSEKRSERSGGWGSTGSK